MQKVKSAIPVYDICSLSGLGQLHADIIAEPFASYLKVHPNLHRAHGHSFYHLVLFTAGAGYHTIDFQHFPVAAGQLYFMVPGQVHSWAFEGDVDGYVVNFSEEFFRSFLSDDRYLDRFPFWNGMTGTNMVTLTGSDLKHAGSLLADVVIETVSTEAFSNDRARILLLSLFILSARAQGSEALPADIKKPNLLVLRNFQKLVDKYYAVHKLPREYAAMLYVTPNYLNALSNDLLGKPAGEVIRERILLEAKRQLVNADASIAGIGYSLGFTDNSYFTKFFKKYTGTTPEDFKRGLQLPSS